MYQLNNWPRKSTINFTLKNCLLGAVILTRNAGKCKFTYNYQWIGFHGKGMWRFGNGFARNVKIFGVYNTSSSHTSNQNITFWYYVKDKPKVLIIALKKKY